MSWEDVKTLRKAGQLMEAREAALHALETDPTDFRTRSQYEWVIFEFIKRLVGKMTTALRNNQPASMQDADEVMDWMRQFYRLQPRVPDMACSSILGQLVKVGPQLSGFPDVIGWVGSNGLRPEDWQPNEYQDRTYPSLAMNIARALCKWARAHPDAGNGQLEMALEWTRRVAQSGKGDDALWLNWDMAILLRQMGDFRQAAELLAGVIKAKRNEFWVWAEAGRLYASDQPELALACYCRALECPAEPKFLVRAHRELAELLAEQEDHAQASREVAITIAIREAEGWSVGREMEALIASPWYDPSAEGAEDPRAFYARHSEAALALCFDTVEKMSANYLGQLVPHVPTDARPGRKPRPLARFAVADADGHAWTLVAPATKTLGFEAGEPLTLVVGRQNGEDRQTIVHVSSRQEGARWDCLEEGRGVVVREPVGTMPLRVLIAGTGDELSLHGLAGDGLHVGDGIRCGMARNPKTSRIDAFNVERAELPDRDVRQVHGPLRRNPKGFAFVDDAFVAPPLVESIDSDIDEVVAVAVYGKHPTEDRRSWRVISIAPAP